MKFVKNLHKLSVCLFLLLFSLSSQTPFLASKETSQEEYKFYSSLFGFGGVGGNQALLSKTNLNNSVKISPDTLKSLANLQAAPLSFLQSSVEIDKIYNPTMDFDPALNLKDNMLLEKFGSGQSYNNLVNKDTFKEVPFVSNNNTAVITANLTPSSPVTSLKPNLNPTVLANNESNSKVF